jgi:hypothetical protein
MNGERDTLQINVPAKAAWLGAISLVITAGGVIFFAGISYQTLQTVVSTLRGVQAVQKADHDAVQRHQIALELRGLLTATPLRAREGP